MPKKGKPKPQPSCGEHRDHLYDADGKCKRCGRVRGAHMKGAQAPTPVPLTPPPPAVPGADPVAAALRAAVPAVPGAQAVPVVPPPAPREPTPEEKEAAEEAKRKRIRIRKLHEWLGRRAFNITEALTDRAVAWARNNTADAVPECELEEKELVAEGFAELSKQAFGEHELTPWGKVALGTAFMGVGKFAATPRLEPVREEPAKPPERPEPAPLSVVRNPSVEP